MGRTVGHHLPSDLPRGAAFTTTCDYCGFLYFRHQLRRDASGFLACEDDYGGSVVELSEANAADAMQILGPREVVDGGNPGPRNEDSPPTITWPDGVDPQF